MKNSAHIFLLLLITCSFLKAGSNDVTPSNLYAPYNQYFLIQSDLEFWTDRKENSVSLKKQAQAHLGMYAIDGQLTQLLEAEEKLNRSLELAPATGSGIYKMLAHIKMKQHRFCEALDDLILAEQMGDELRYTQALLFDVYFELGNEEQAEYHLGLLENQIDFEYLIRAARFEDSKGELESAIQLLEKAKAKIAPNDWNNQSWIYSNLADFYGHAGKVQKSRSHFIKALELNPSDWYSLKGLAWIAYASDNDANKALSYLEKIDSNYDIPSVQYLKSEILEFIGAADQAHEIRTELLEIISQESYHSSYSTMLFDLWSKDQNKAEAMKNLVSATLDDTPTPENYALLSQWYAINGQPEEARRIAQNFVLGKTFEPDALRRVYPSLEKGKQHNEIVSILGDAAFELGPSVMKALDI